MSKRIQVLEYSQAPIKDGVILGVKIVGTQSNKGYVYPQPVLDEAIGLYENAPVFILHPSDGEKARGVRKYDDHFGSLKNIQGRYDGKIGLGLFGDLHIKQSHPLSQMVIESDGKKFGLSHNAMCDLNDDETEVTKIHEVNSVDLVDHPGTTKNLFEGNEEMTLEEFKAENAAMAKTVAALDAKLTTVLESIEGKPEKKKRLEVLEDSTDGEEAPLMGLGHEAFAAGMNGINLEGAKA